MDDAAFGIGAYRYYADIAPAYLRWFAGCCCCRAAIAQPGLAQMEEASRHGQLVRGEAQYQLHIVYLWYEQRFMDALALVRGLQARYPRNPLFRQIEARSSTSTSTISARSLAASEALRRRRGSAARSTGRAWRRGARAPQHRGAARSTSDSAIARASTIDALLAADPPRRSTRSARARELQRAWSAR